MKKKIIIVMVAMVALLSLTACGQQKGGETNAQKETVTYLSNNVYTYVDPETGVNYLIYHGYNSAGMSVRYDSEGHVVVTK